MEEIWRKVEEYEYEVSNQGNVRRVGGRILKPGTIKNKNGKIDALLVNLYKNGKKTAKKVHRLVALTFIPNPENKAEVDHIDCNTTNNNVSNLRWATKSENECNKSRRCDNTSGFKGVSFHKARNKFQAYISINGKTTYLGYFSTAEQAFEAYKQKAQELHKDFAKY